MRFEVVRIREVEGAKAALAAAYETMVRWLDGLPEFAGWPDVTVRVMLGGAEECRFWKVTEQCLGFHAVAALNVDDDGDDWYEVNEFIEVHLNLDSGLRELASDWPAQSELDRECELEALLATAPHEILHAVDWLRETGGRTPLEVFDQEDGEIALRRVCDRLEDGGAAEDRVEGEAREIAMRFCSGRVGALAEAIGGAMEAERAHAPRL